MLATVAGNNAAKDEKKCGCIQLEYILEKKNTSTKRGWRKKEKKGVRIKLEKKETQRATQKTQAIA